MRQTACYLPAATGGLQETMFIYACRSQALAYTRSPRRACTSQLTEFQPVGGAHEQASHAAGILMLVLMLLIPGLHKAPQQALLTLPYWQHCLQFPERWLELAWTTGSFKILHPRESSSHNEDYRSTGKRPSPRDPPFISSRKGKDTHRAGEAARKKAALLLYSYHTEIPGPRAMQTF